MVDWCLDVAKALTVLGMVLVLILVFSEWAEWWTASAAFMFASVFLWLAHLYKEG